MDVFRLQAILSILLCVPGYSGPGCSAIRSVQFVGILNAAADSYRRFFNVMKTVVTIINYLSENTSNGRSQWLQHQKNIGLEDRETLHIALHSIEYISFESGR